MVVAEQAIGRTCAFFSALGMPATLRDVGIGGERLSEMAHHVAATEGLERAWVPLNEDDILRILKNCL